MSFDAVISTGTSKGQNVVTTNCGELEIDEDDAVMLDEHIARGGPVEKKREGMGPATQWTIAHLSNQFRQNTVNEELRRLQATKSYISVEPDDTLNSLTRMASRVFGTSLALISLVDMEQTRLVSTHGSISTQSLSILKSFCSYTLLSKSGMLVVPDATQDIRFKSEHLVQENGVCFYAGAALMAPEGIEVGTFSIIDQTPRPQGLSTSEQEILRDFANLAMKSLMERVDRHFVDEERQQIIAQTAHDLLTPLTGIQISIQLLRDDKQLNQKMNEKERELINTASSCADVMTGLCQSTISSLRSGETREHEIISEITNNTKECRVSEMVEHMRHMMHPIPKKAPLIFSIEKSTPDLIRCNDIKVIRTALTFLFTACDRTESGSIHLHVEYDKNTSHLIFECEDTAPRISDSDAVKLFDLGVNPASLEDPRLMGLGFSGRQVVNAGGRIGYQASSHKLRTKNPDSTPDASIKWFSFPVEIVQETHPFIPTIDSNGAPDLSTRTANSLISHDDTSLCDASDSCLCPNDTLDGHFPTRRVGRALIIDDSLIIRKTLCRALRKLGYEVHVAEDGMNGLQALKESLYDICLCDFLMPRMDGMDCITQLRAWERDHRPFFRQHVIGISAHASEKDASLGLESGMDLFVLKPVTPKLLQQLLEMEELVAVSKQIDELNRFNESFMDCRMAEADLNRDSSEEQVSDKKFSALDSSSVSSLSLNEGTSHPVCLFVTSNSESEASRNFLEDLKNNGWSFELVQSCQESLRLMKLRNWDAIVVDDRFQSLDIIHCLAEFRLWEKNHRINLQTNIFLQRNTCKEWYRLDGESQIVGPFDGVFSSSANGWSDFQRLLDNWHHRHAVTGNMVIISR